MGTILYVDFYSRLMKEYKFVSKTINIVASGKIYSDLTPEA